jgi:hypothetical protein
MVLKDWTWSDSHLLRAQMNRSSIRKVDAKFCVGSSILKTKHSGEV